MDLEREMESLAREARKKLAADEKLAAEEASRPRPQALQDELAPESEEAEPPIGLGTKLLALLGAVAALWLAWVFVVGPVVKVTITLVVLVAAVGLFFKLVGGSKPS